MRLIPNKKKQGIFVRFMVSYLLIFALAMFICISGYIVALRIVEKDIMDANMSMLNQSKDIIDQKLFTINIAAMQIATNPKIINACDLDESNKEFSYLSLREIVSELASYKLNLDRDFIYDYYVYSKRNNYIFTPETVYKADFYYNYVLKNKSIDYSDWRNKILNQNHNGDYSKSTFFEFDNYEKKNIIMYLQSIPLSIKKESNGTLVFLLNQDGIESLFSRIDLSQGGWIYIQDKQGNIITTISNKKEDVQYLDLEKHKASEGFFKQSINHKNMIINYTTSNNGWRYVLALPENIAMNRLNSFRRFILVIFLTAIIIGIFIAYFMALKSSKPINNILTHIKEALGGDELKYNDDAFNAINNTISALIISNKSLQEKIAEQKPILLNAFIDRLLKGEFSNNNEVAVNASYIGIDFSMDQCLVLLLRIYDRKDINEINKQIVNELNTVKVLLRDTLNSYFNYKALCHDLGPQTMAVIVCLDSDEDYKEKVTSAVESIFDEFDKLYSLKILFGIGNMYKSALEIWKSYQEAMETLDYIQLHKGKKKMWYDEIPKEEHVFYYPVDIEQRIINCVKTGDIVQVKSVFSIIADENFNNRNLSENMTKQLFYEIKGTLTKLTQQVPKDAELLAKISKLDYEKCKNENNLQKLLLMFEDMCRCVGEHKNDRDHCVIEKILKYIETNYMNSELSLSLVASEFHFSESYLSYFFKEQAGQNFTDYVEQVRMNNACILLKDPLLSIDEISKRTGYSNVKSFRRAFKRIYGVSPSAMRDNL